MSCEGSSLGCLGLQLLIRILAAMLDCTLRPLRLYQLLIKVEGKTKLDAGANRAGTETWRPDL